MGLEYMDTDLLGIAEVLASNKIKVPAHQRSYAWDTQNVTDLFNDRTEAQFRSYLRYYISDHRPIWAELRINIP